MAVIVSKTSATGEGLHARTGESAWQMIRRSRLWTAVQGIGFLLLSGSVGFWILGRLHFKGLIAPQLKEPWSFFDCIYMTVITFSTIGYGETLGDLTEYPVVRVFTIALILTGMLLVAYSVSSATAFFVSGDLQRLLERRRTMNQIAGMSGHYILCGCGITGTVILKELLDTGNRVVVCDTNGERLEEFGDEERVIGIRGDATSDDVLMEAGIERAAGLAAALPGDKDNLFLIIGARQLNPDLRIVSLASHDSVKSKLRRAGADAVVAMASIGGLRLASELMRPAVVTFLDMMLRKSDSQVRFAQVDVGSEWAGRKLSEVGIMEKTGLPILGLRPVGGDGFVFNPGPDEVLREGMALVTMGGVERVKELDRLIGDPDGALVLGPDGDGAATESKA